MGGNRPSVLFTEQRCGGIRRYRRTVEHRWHAAVRQIKRLLKWLYRVRGALFWGFRSFQQNPAGRRDKSHRDFLLLVPKEELNLLQDRHVYYRQQHPLRCHGQLDR